MLHDYMNCGGRMRNFKVRKCRNYIGVGPPEKERNILETLQNNAHREDESRAAFLLFGRHIFH